MTRVVVAIALLGFAPVFASEDRPDPCNPVTAECLAHISMEESGPEMEPIDPKYLSVVSRGLAVVPDLGRLLSDSTVTQERVALFGGQWAIGDIAMSAISNIISGVPWVEFIGQDAVKQFDSRGFFVYWEYVRESSSHRQVMRERFLPGTRHMLVILFGSRTRNHRPGVTMSNDLLASVPPNNTLHLTAGASGPARTFVRTLAHRRLAWRSADKASTKRFSLC